MLDVYMEDPGETVEREAKEEKKSLDKFLGFGFRVPGFGFRVSGFGFRVLQHTA